MRTGVLLAVVISTLSLAASPAKNQASPAGFDHQYRAYATLLQGHVERGGVNYRRLLGNRSALDAVVRELGAVDKAGEQAFTREERLAYWINAYNLFTLRAVADHYPIQGRWFSIYPRNSIRQIDGVWTRIRWRAGGSDLTLDQIEHEIIRPVFKEPLVNFALACGAVSCAPLQGEPFLADRLPQQLESAARAFLAEEQGSRVSGDRLDVSSRFKWYADDFRAGFAGLVTASRSETDRGILGFVATYGPAKAAALARHPAVRLDYLEFDWSLNEADRAGATD
jgi:hypothetical protein